MAKRDLFKGQLPFGVLNPRTENDVHVLDLVGWHPDFKYALRLEVKANLSAAPFTFHENAITFRSVGDESDAALRALGEALGQEVPATRKFPAAITLPSAVALDGSAGNILKERVRFKGFLRGGDVEFYLDVDVPAQACVLRPRDRYEELVAALSA